MLVPQPPLNLESLWPRSQLPSKMALSKFDGLELPASADFHVHLRDGMSLYSLVFGVIKSNDLVCGFVAELLTVVYIS